MNTNSEHTKAANAESTTLSSSRPQPRTHQSQRLPQTALFSGPNARNKNKQDTGSEPSKQSPQDKQQHLPRAEPPTTSFSALRPSLIGQATAPAGRKKDEDFRADALWAEMQRTLADVELSAMNSSHVFSSTHATALEGLRSAQLGLAQAWATSEKEEMADEEFGNEAPDAQAIGTLKHGMFGSPTSGKNRSSTGSANSAGERKLEEETERDIQLARKRREANDRYFKQVDKGVLDIVGKLDEIVNAMRKVEQESRELWNESSSTDELEEATGTDPDAQMAADDSDALTDVLTSIKK